MTRHDKKSAYKLFKDKFKTGLSIKGNRLIAELKQLPSPPCDMADAFALYYPVTAKVDKALLNGDMHVEFVLSNKLIGILRNQ